MSSEWRPFTELLSAIVDNRGRTCPVGDEGIPLIATNCVDRSNLYPSYDTTRFVSEETYKTWFRGHPLPADILFVCKGSPGRTNWVPDPVDFCIAQDMVAVRADPKKVYPKYLFAALRSSVVQTQIDNMHVGTMIPHFKKGDFGKLNIPVPSPDVQRIIGDFYFTLTERITLLHETNATLEAIAQAMFKSWFVDFDPVHAKQQGRAPEGMSEATPARSTPEGAPGVPPDPSAATALFPDSFEESELGLVPSGWRVSRVGQEVVTTDYVANGSFASLKANVTLHSDPNFALFVRTTDYNSEFKGAFRYVDKSAYEFLSKSPLDASDVIISNVGDVGTVFRPPVWLGLPMTLGSNAVALKNPKISGYLFYFFKSDRGQHAIKSIVTGSAQLKFNKTNLRSLPLLMPTENVLSAFEGVTKSLLAEMDNNRGKAQTLATLRDTLLPRLISGQLRLPEAEAALEEVTA